MPPFLQAQNVAFHIVVVEQRQPEAAFNRAKLFNVGFVEVMKMSNGGKMCAIFHDVDLIPLDGRNIYACTQQPRHMSANVDLFRFNLMYGDQFGGVVAITADHFIRVNGFSNKFYGECFDRVRTFSFSTDRLFWLAKLVSPRMGHVHAHRMGR